jgi:hypothetical protein
MKSLKLIVFIVLTLTLTFCKNTAKNEQYAESEKIYKMAINIHDEVMPLMGEIVELQSLLKSKKEEVTDDLSIEKINMTLQNLENAHNSMMLWMRNITPIPAMSDKDTGMTSEHPSANEMLEIQKKSLEDIKKVKEAMLTSIEEANTLISEF